MNPSDFGLEVTVEIINPAEAEAYLKNNAMHRKIKQKKVDEYKNQMVDGKWQLNGKALIFDSNGRLLNGQHRLSAVVQSQVPLTTVVIRGVDPSVLETNPENGVIIEE
jgi:hypothetical protein